MTGRDLRCEEALRLLADYLDHELAPEDHTRVRHHLDTCRSCFSRAEFERRLKHQLGELRSEPVAPRLEHRVRSMLQDFGVSPSDQIAE